MTTVNRKPFVDSHTDGYNQDTIYDGMGAAKLPKADFMQRKSSEIKSGHNFMMGGPGKDTPTSMEAPPPISSQRSGNTSSRKPLQRIPEGIKYKKNIIHGTILGATNANSV